MKFAILGVFAWAFDNGSDLDRFSVKFTPRNNSETVGQTTVHIKVSGVLDYTLFLNVSMVIS